MKNNSLLVMFSSGNIGSGPFFSLNALYAYKTGEHLVQLFLGIYKVRSLVLLLLLIREVKHHVCVKRQMQICTTWPSFPLYLSFTVHYFYT